MIKDLETFVPCLCMLGLAAGAPPMTAATSEASWATNHVASADDLTSHIQIHLPSSGVLIAEYRLPVENGDGEFRPLLIGFDASSGAWFKYRPGDARLAGCDAKGAPISGKFGNGLFTPSEGETAPHDRIIQSFFPQVILRDIVSHPDVVTEVKSRDDGGFDAVANLLIMREPSETSKPMPVPFGVDSVGRLEWIEWTKGHRTTFEYSDISPEGFPLPDPAHGGNWRLHRAVVREEAAASELISPKGVAILAELWDMPLSPTDPPPPKPITPSAAPHSPR